MDITLWIELITFVILMGFSAFFSSSETGMMALNRYRLRHLAESGHPGAKKATALRAGDSISAVPGCW